MLSRYPRSIGKLNRLRKEWLAASSAPSKGNNLFVWFQGFGGHSPPNEAVVLFL